MVPVGGGGWTLRAALLAGFFFAAFDPFFLAAFFFAAFFFVATFFVAFFAIRCAPLLCDVFAATT
jgi:hypothetical protein